MHSFLYNLLTDPYTKDNLRVISFDNSNEATGIIMNGILLNEKNFTIYPIIHKTPILIKNRIPKDFYNKFKNNFAEYIKTEDVTKKQLSKIKSSYSFSNEWEQFHKDKMDKTWGWTAKDRVEAFFIETQTNREEIKNKIILDAGCGNGLLTRELASNGAIAIGIDYSESIYPISFANNNTNLLYIQGDLQNPPLKAECIDIMISHGVIHHTKSTKNTFKQIAPIVKPNGKLYLWLYRRPFTTYFKIFIRTTDVMRFFVSRMPHFIQKNIVNTYSYFFYYLKKLKGTGIMDFHQLRIDAYDTLTPRYKHYHQPIEVAEWFHESGYDSPILTHWDNPYGFGLYSVKRKQELTAGENFKNKNPKRRYSSM